MVYRRVDRLAQTHVKAKGGRYGYLVRPLTLVLGWSVLILGLITIPLPGQGWLTTFLGVGILSFEQRWARRLLRAGRCAAAGSSTTAPASGSTGSPSCSASRW